MKFFTILLVFTLLAGIGIAAYLVWTNSAAPAAAPSIELRSVEIGNTVTVAVNVRGERVTRAELWSEAQLLARETNPNPALSNLWPVVWQWTPPAPGVYPLTARAFDEAERYGSAVLVDAVVPPRQRLVFSSNRDGKAALYEIAPPTRETIPLPSPQGQDRQPNVSKLGVIAFASNRAGAWHILTRAANSSTATDLTPDLISAQRPVWSPDGQRLAFEATISNTTNIFLADAHGQNRVQMTRGETYDGQTTFSPDGKQIAFASQRDSRWDIYTVDVNGQNLTRLTNDTASSWQPAWSPDGNRLAFASNRSGISQLYVAQLTGNGEAVRITNIPSGAEQPAWSPDGNWLAFVAYTGEAQDNNRREIYLLYVPKDQPPVVGRGLIRLTQNAFDDTEPAWIGP